jgi:hypothetical protein
LFSLISATVVTENHQAGVQTSAGVRNGGRSNGAASGSVLATPLRYRTDLGDGQRDLVGGECHRLSVKLPPETIFAFDGSSTNRIVQTPHWLRSPASTDRRSATVNAAPATCTAGSGHNRDLRAVSPSRWLSPDYRIDHHRARGAGDVNLAAMTEGVNACFKRNASSP